MPLIPDYIKEECHGLANMQLLCFGYLGKIVGSKLLINRDSEGRIEDSDTIYYYLSGGTFIIGVVTTMFMLDVMNTKSAKSEREYESYRSTLSIIARETYSLVLYEPYIIIAILGSVVTLIVRLSVEYLVPHSVYTQFVLALGENSNQEQKDDAIKRGENYLYIL